MSMGLAVVGPEDNVGSLYERADQALYKSKELGRNRLYTLVEGGPEEENPAPLPAPSYEEFKASFGVDTNVDA